MHRISPLAPILRPAVPRILSGPRTTRLPRRRPGGAPARRAPANRPSERSPLRHLPSQNAHLAVGVVALDDLVQQDLEPLRVDRLREAVVRALLDRRDRGLPPAPARPP